MSSVGEYLFLVSEMMLGFFVVCFLGFGLFFFFFCGGKNQSVLTPAAVWVNKEAFRFGWGAFLAWHFTSLICADMAF